MGSSFTGSSSISFSGLRTAWGNASYAGGSDPGASNISLSEFRNATFTDGSSVPSSGEISINDDLANKTFGSAAPSDITNHIQMKYHRYGSTFNDSWTPSGKSTLEDGTFTLYFWKTSDNSLTQLGRLTNQQHTSTTNSYTTVTYDISQPENTSGYLLFILYGWNMFRADMAIGEVIHQFDDNSTKQTLYSPSSNSTTTKNGQDWKKTSRQREFVNSYSSTTVSDIEDEIATKSQSDSWSNLPVGTSTSGGWQQDRLGTPSSSTGPAIGSDGSGLSYYIYCETSGQTSTSYIAYAALRVPITISSS